MTAPDPGLTDLIAAHYRHCVSEEIRLNPETGVHTYWIECTCVCGADTSVEVTGDREAAARLADAAHVASVVEQHANGRIASDLGADPQDYEIAWAAKLRWQARAEKAEAMIARVCAVESEYLDPEDADIECREDVWRFIRDLRAALEGVGDADPT